MSTVEAVRYSRATRSQNTILIFNLIIGIAGPLPFNLMMAFPLTAALFLAEASRPLRVIVLVVSAFMLSTGMLTI